MNTTRWAALAVGTTAALGALAATAVALDSDEETRIQIEPVAWSWNDPDPDSWLRDLDVRIDADVDAVLERGRAAGVRHVRGRLTEVSLDDDDTSVVIDGVRYEVAVDAVGWWDGAWTSWLSGSVDLRTRPISVRATLDADGDVIRLRRA